MTQRTHYTKADIADAYDRGVDEGIDIVIELVRRHIPDQHRHAVEQAIAEFLAHPGAETRRELLARRDEQDDDG